MWNLAQAPVATADAAEPRYVVSGNPYRTRDDLKQVFARNRDAIFSLYSRALLKDPTIAGTAVFELTIAPAGRVVDCRIVSSELHDPQFEENLLALVRQFDFGSKHVPQTVVTWPVDFSPQFPNR